MGGQCVRGKEGANSSGSVSEDPPLSRAISILAFPSLPPLFTCSTDLNCNYLYCICTSSDSRREENGQQLSLPSVAFLLLPLVVVVTDLAMDPSSVDEGDHDDDRPGQQADVEEGSISRRRRGLVLLGSAIVTVSVCSTDQSCQVSR